MLNKNDRKVLGNFEGYCVEDMDRIGQQHESY